MKISEVFRFSEKVPVTVHVQIKDADKWINWMMDRYEDATNKKLVWLSDYDKIVDWLSDNQGKGLLMFGTCGLGKTLLARYLIPAIWEEAAHKIFQFYSMVDIISESDLLNAKRHKLLVLDDVGVEGPLNSYGTKHYAFEELMDAVEKDNKIVIITTNLTGQQLLQKYGERTMDRIKATTIRVKFEGDSLRSR